MSHFVQKYQIIGRVPATQRFDALACDMLF